MMLRAKSAVVTVADLERFIDEAKASKKRITRKALREFIAKHRREVPALVVEGAGGAGEPLVVREQPPVFDGPLARAGRAFVRGRAEKSVEAFLAGGARK